MTAAPAPDHQHVLLELAVVLRVEGPPTLAVEIRSPSTAHVDRGVKLQRYARHRVPYYWIVDLGSRAIEAYVRNGEADALAARAAGSQVASPPPCPDLRLDLSTLWA